MKNKLLNTVQTGGFGPGGAMREKNMNTVTENDNQSKSRKHFWQSGKA